jgi:NADPH2:quinone reductase
MIFLDATIRFVLVYVMTAEAHREAAAGINAALEANQLTHQIGRVLTLDDIVAAHEAVERGELGKTIIALG